MSTKNELISQLAALGWEAISATKTLKPKFEQAVKLATSGKELDLKIFKRISSPVVEVDQVPVEPKETKQEVPVLEAKKKIVKKVTAPPVVETPPVPPVVETPVVETPVVETPVVETPVVETPVVEIKKKIVKKATQPVETPVVEKPQPVVDTVEVTKPLPLPQPQQRVEKNILNGTVTIKSEDLISILDAASSLSSNDYTDILMKLSSFCGGAVNTTRKQISSVLSTKKLEVTREEYLLFKKYYTPQISPQSIAEKSGLDISKVYSSMMNSAKYAAAYRE
jgi:hypothetical protein